MLQTKNLPAYFNNDIFLFFMLLGLTLLSTIFNVNVVYGLTFSFSSIFTFLVLRIFGLRFAIITALLTFLCIPHESIYIAYNIIFLVEILFVGTYFLIKNSAKMFFVDALFWLTIGLATIFTLNKTSLAGDALYFQICKDILNGLFNVLIADMLLAYFPFYKLLKSKKLNKNNVSVHQFLTHLSILFLIVPLFLGTLTKTWSAHDEITRDANSKAIISSMQIKKEIQLLAENNPNFSIDYMKQKRSFKEIVERFKSQDFNIIITNSKNKVITFSSNMAPITDNYFHWKNTSEVKKISNSFYEVLPKERNNVFPILKWRSGNIVFIDTLDSLSLKVFIQFPIAQYQDQIFQDFLIHLRASVLFSIFTVIFIQVINRWFITNIEQLTIVTTNLPKKLFNLEKLDWPHSNISELRLLTQNLKEMAKKLKELFQESIEMNRILTIQTKQLKTSEEKLHQLAYYDGLTDLPNRLHFQNYVKDLIKNNSSEKIAIIFIDLNQFKQVNDTLGHDAGDTLLKLTANRFRHLLDIHRMVFRLSGDEFVVVQSFKDQEEITSTLAQIQNEFSLPFQLSGHQLYITASVGVSIYPDNGLELDSLVKCADIAMYGSKDKGGNAAQFFHESMRDRFQGRLVIENALRAIVDNNGFRLFYQPKIQFGQVSSLEALLRWNDPNLGNVSPSTFIPIAEEIGLISKIDEWTLIEACRQNKIWQNQYSLDIPVSVNISAVNFQNDGLVPLINKALAISGLDAKYLKLEITESVFIKDSNHVAKVINEIKTLGVSISIDDFGKGYSAFIHLLQLPIDEIKIDRQFIHEIHRDEKKELLVKSLLDLAHGLHLNVVAEGIETSNERDLLNHLGCDELQGYLFSPPLSATEMEKLLCLSNTNQQTLRSNWFEETVK